MEFRYIALKGKEIRFKYKSAYEKETQYRDKERGNERESIIITVEKIKAISYFAQYTKGCMY